MHNCIYAVKDNDNVKKDFERESKKINKRNAAMILNVRKTLNCTHFWMPAFLG